MNTLIEIIFNSDDILSALVTENIFNAYVFLFLLIMLESGLIFFPFLPGDSLLFSAGIVAASTAINIWLLVFILILAATVGNYINYNFGKYFIPRLKRIQPGLLQKFIYKYFQKTELFYHKHGAKAIIIGRFFPILRTYIPFLAGIVSMKHNKFMKYTVIGATLWIMLFSLTGFFIGKIEWVQNNYGVLLLSVLFITLIPLIIKIIRILYSGIMNTESFKTFGN